MEFEFRSKLNTTLRIGVKQKRYWSIPDCRLYDKPTRQRQCCQK